MVLHPGDLAGSSLHAPRAQGTWPAQCWTPNHLLLSWCECHTRARTVGRAGAAPPAWLCALPRVPQPPAAPSVSQPPLGDQQVTPEL